MTKSYSKWGGILQKYSSNSSTKTIIFQLSSPSIFAPKCNTLILFNSHFNPYTTATIPEMSFLTITLKHHHVRPAFQSPSSPSRQLHDKNDKLEPETPSKHLCVMYSNLSATTLGSLLVLKNRILLAYTVVVPVFKDVPL
jgi:hypothetical protein